MLGGGDGGVGRRFCNSYMECLGTPCSWSALMHINVIKYAHNIIIMHNIISNAYKDNMYIIYNYYVHYDTPNTECLDTPCNFHSIPSITTGKRECHVA